MPTPIGMNFSQGSATGMTYGVNPDASAQGSYGLMQQQQAAKAQKDRDAAQYGYQSGLAQQGYAADAAKQAMQAQLQREGYNNSLQQTRIQADASKYPYDIKNQHWNQLFPAVQGMLGGGLSGGTYGQYAGAGPVGQQPYISDAPVYNNQQIQEQVNSSRAQGDAGVASKQRANNNSMAGRGFGSRSPLAMAMNNAVFGQNLAANTQAENQLRFDAAGANSKQVLAAQQAREGQYASRQQEDIDRNKVRSGLISSLFGMLGGGL